MSMNNQGRPTRGENVVANDSVTFTGNKALQIEEPLIFEVGDFSGTGVDIVVPEHSGNRLGGLERNRDIGLPGLSEPETMRHFVRLSQKNYAIDMGPVSYTHLTLPTIYSV